MKGINMVKVNAYLSMYVECPFCEDTFDLISHDVNDDHLFTGKFIAWLNNEKEDNKIKENVDCPTCFKCIELSEIEY
jgi:C4-type Zn-finger protein